MEDWKGTLYRVRGVIGGIELRSERKQITLVFWGFNSRWLELAQMLILSKCSCSFLMTSDSSEGWKDKYISWSSAKRWYWEWEVDWKRSFVYTKKRERVLEGHLPGTTTCWEWIVRNDWNLWMTPWDRKVFWWLERKLSWSTMSKALKKSRRIRMVRYWLPIAL